MKKLFELMGFKIYNSVRAGTFIPTVRICSNILMVIGMIIILLSNRDYKLISCMALCGVFMELEILADVFQLSVKNSKILVGNMFGNPIANQIAIQRTLLDRQIHSLLKTIL